MLPAAGAAHHRRARHVGQGTDRPAERKGRKPGKRRGRRGIPRELWDDAQQELPEQDDQIDTLLRRRLRSDTPDRDELRRASDYLYRRGFGRDEIRAAIARYQDNYEEY